MCVVFHLHVVWLRACFINFIFFFNWEEKDISKSNESKNTRITDKVMGENSKVTVY